VSSFQNWRASKNGARGGHAHHAYARCAAPWPQPTRLRSGGPQTPAVFLLGMAAALAVLFSGCGRACRRPHACGRDGFLFFIHYARSPTRRPSSHGGKRAPPPRLPKNARPIPADCSHRARSLSRIHTCPFFSILGLLLLVHTWPDCPFLLPFDVARCFLLTPCRTIVCCLGGRRSTTCGRPT
jgi:hypothetical protein